LGLFRVLSYGGPSPRDSGVFLPFMLFASSVIYLSSCAVSCWAWKAMQGSRAGLLDDAADVEHGQYAHAEDGAQAMLRAFEFSRRDAELSTSPVRAAPRTFEAWQPPGQVQDGSDDDPALRMAIQASMRAQAGGNAALEENEEDALLMAAVQESQAAAMAGDAAGPEVQRIVRQAEVQEGRRIVQDQNAEFEESLAMDRAREVSEQEAIEQSREEEQRLREEEAQLLKEEAEAQSVEDERKAAALRAFEEKRARLPEEPMAGEKGRVALLFRLPSGQRRQRAFRASDFVSSLYDFAETEDPEMAESTYCLVTQVPRRVYKDREQTLEAAGVENQCVILAEALD